MGYQMYGVLIVRKIECILPPTPAGLVGSPSTITDNSIRGAAVLGSPQTWNQPPVDQPPVPLSVMWTVAILAALLAPSLGARLPLTTNEATYGYSEYIVGGHVVKPPGKWPWQVQPYLSSTFNSLDLPVIYLQLIRPTCLLPSTH